ncbi:MAG TPA: Uma2 family endonuclease [Kofleriaceae bacterium]
MVAARDALDSADAERRFLLSDVPWTVYVSLRDTLDTTRIRMTYLAGRLELMSPSELHEEESKLIARLLEAWAEENDIDLRGFKSTTFRSEAEARGAEPDECYTIGPKAKDAPPQIAIEVIVASPLFDKLDVYAGLGVAEVWIWHSTSRNFAVHRLRAGRYEAVTSSELLQPLDLGLLASFVRTGENHTALVKSYRAALRR